MMGTLVGAYAGSFELPRNLSGLTIARDGQQKSKYLVLEITDQYLFECCTDLAKYLSISTSTHEP